MSLHGMDLEQGERLAKELSRASRRFAQLSGQLTPVIAASPWRGPDGEQFRSDWKAHSRMLLATSEALRAASDAVRENVRQQQDASSGRSVGARVDGQASTSQYGSAATPLLDTLIAGAGGRPATCGTEPASSSTPWAARWATAWAGSEAGRPGPRPIWLMRAAICWADCATSAASAGTFSAPESRRRSPN
ncbi:hypothetical protein PJ267_10055 [Arthrobacter sp. OVS8]|nr:hypothetical protein PJ267_10055 [Arthrobacter sp. OVS8]